MSCVEPGERIHKPPDRACQKGAEIILQFERTESKQLKQFIRKNIAKNNPTTLEDVQLTNNVFGKDVANYLKGTSTRLHLPVVTREDMIDLPPELQINEVDLAINVLFINGQVFLYAKDRTIKFKDLVGGEKQVI